jgi:Fic family protein
VSAGQYFPVKIEAKMKEYTEIKKQLARLQFKGRKKRMESRKLLTDLLKEFNDLGIQDQIDYQKFYLYSIITHSTAIEGSTVTEVENQLLFDQGIPASRRSMTEQFMNLDLKAAYEKSMQFAKEKKEITIDMLKELSALVMKNTGTVYNTISGSFDAAKGELRLVNVSAGIGGKSYLSYTKVPDYLEKFCSWLNTERRQLPEGDVYAAYTLSFEAHYRLVTIHPWVDGNGRMSRLVMNQLQFEQNQLPTIVYTDHKASYINALVEARDKDDISIFCGFMFNELITYLKNSIAEYRKSIQGIETAVLSDTLGEKHTGWEEKLGENQQRILELLKECPTLTTNELAQELKLSTTAIENNISKLKKKGLLERIGPDKGGHWQVV